MVSKSLCCTYYKTLKYKYEYERKYSKYCKFNLSYITYNALDIVYSKVAVLVVALFVYHKTFDIFGNTGDTLEYTNKSVQSPSKQSLLIPHKMDYQECLRNRQQNIQKWQKHHGHNFEYDMTGIDRRNNLSLQEFWDVYDGKWPVILTDVVPKWPGFKWTGDFLNATYGSEHVVTKVFDKELDSAISDVLDYILDTTKSKISKTDVNQAVTLPMPLHLFYKNKESAVPTSWTYITDELFIPTRPELRRDIWHTEYWTENFFEHFPKEIRPWDAMLLWGTNYSRSSLHIDPYNWTGTNAVISGRKSWKLFPPGQDHLLYVEKNIKSGFPLECFKYNSPIDAFDVDTKRHPLFRNAHYISFEQLPGELLIIPSGWLHQAYNSEETLAISGQMMNRNNYRVVLEEIIKAGNVDREMLPPDIEQMAPSQQVSTLMSALPSHLLKKGKTVTNNVIRRIKRRTKWT